MAILLVQAPNVPSVPAEIDHLSMRFCAALLTRSSYHTGPYSDFPLLLSLSHAGVRAVQKSCWLAQPDRAAARRGFLQW